jgi:hypothetical protein
MVNINEIGSIIALTDVDGRELLMDRETKFYNVSKALNGTNKEFKLYRQTKDYQNKYDYVRNKINKEPIINTYLNSEKRIMGYYVHEDLLFYVMIWASFEYADKCISIIKSYREEINKKQFQEVIKKKDNIIDACKNELEKVKESNQEIKDLLILIKDQNKEIKIQNDELKDQNKEIKVQNKEIKNQNRNLAHAVHKSEIVIKQSNKKVDILTEKMETAIQCVAKPNPSTRNLQQYALIKVYNETYIKLIVGKHSYITKTINKYMKEEINVEFISQKYNPCPSDLKVWIKKAIVNIKLNFEKEKRDYTVYYQKIIKKLKDDQKYEKENTPKKKHEEINEWYNKTIKQETLIYNKKMNKYDLLIREAPEMYNADINIKNYTINELTTIINNCVKDQSDIV